MTLELQIQPIILHLCVIKQVAGKIIVGDHLVPPLGLAQIIHLMRITTAKKGLYNVSLALGPIYVIHGIKPINTVYH